jgi:hypothetical protein
MKVLANDTRLVAGVVSSNPADSVKSPEIVRVTGLTHRNLDSSVTIWFIVWLTLELPFLTTAPVMLDLLLEHTPRPQ